METLEKKSSDSFCVRALLSALFVAFAILKYLGIQKIIVSESPSVACAELKKGAADIDVILVDEPVVSSTTQEDWFKCAGSGQIVVRQKF